MQSVELRTPRQYPFPLRGCSAIDEESKFPRVGMCGYTGGADFE
jgi:hypothetical protein